MAYSTVDMACEWQVKLQHFDGGHFQAEFVIV